MNTRLVNTAADVINAALKQDRTAAGIAMALESAQLLQSPDTATEFEKLVRWHREDAVTIDRLQRQVAELKAAPTTVYRAEHPDSGITLGHYGTEAAARAHCEATERRSWPTGTSLSFDWIWDALPEDDENGIAELVVTAGQNEESTTGYIVTALELASEYDEEADE